MIKDSEEVRSPDPNGTKQENQTVNCVQQSSWTLQGVNRTRPHLWDEFLRGHSGCRLIQSLSPSINGETQRQQRAADTESQCQAHRGWFNFKKQRNILILKQQQNHHCSIYTLDLIQNCLNNHKVSTRVSMWTLGIWVFFFNKAGSEESGCAAAPSGWNYNTASPA